MKKWNFYTSDEIKPQGWLKRRLEIQAQGLSGNLDKMWRDVRDSSWIGGDAEGWERVPYWLDGFVPLAYLLEDKDMIARAKKYIDAIVENQKADGWICPCSDDERNNYDTWAVMLLTKVLTVYYECSKDQRIPKVIYDVLKNYHELLKSEKIKLFQWGKYRWFECFIAINFVYEKYGEEWLLDLARLLKEQGKDYSEITYLWERPLNAWKLDTHIVNIAMYLKHEAVSSHLLGTAYTDNAQTLYDMLCKYNGTPVGLFTGDECLSGLSPIQGTELCSVVEQMYSYELLFAFTGDSKWAERLEVLAYNALPATISDDMWTHQYVQMSNQIACIRFPGRSLFRTNNEEAHLFGLEPNFGCCTANFNQGYPKLCLSAFMHDTDKIINAVAVPSSLSCDKAEIKLETDYPFVNKFKYTVQAKEDFIFQIRIPSFAQNVKVKGKDFDSASSSFTFKAGEKAEISVDFETVAFMESRPHGLNTIKCGSLVFSLPIEYEKKMYEYEKDNVERKFPYCDYEYYPKSKWNYAYCGDFAKPVFEGISDIPFSSENPELTLEAEVCEINWGLEEGFETVCAKIPQATEPLGEKQTVKLVPYGCAKLRMTELPKINK